jgi:hypothetical protein
MGNNTTALVIVLSINVMLFLGQAASLSLNPAGTKYYNNAGTLISDFDNGNYTVPNDPNNLIPSGESSVNAETGNIFTDTFTTARSWILEKTGLGYLVNLLGAPANFLKAIGLPDVFAWGVGSMWYGVTLFFIVSWIMGRET